MNVFGVNSEIEITTCISQLPTFLYLSFTDFGAHLLKMQIKRFLSTT